VRPEKQSVIEELKASIEGASAVIFTNYSGAGAEQMGALRGALREWSGRYMVVKNRLFALAAKAAGIEGELPGFGGQVGVTFGDEESSVPLLKALVAFHKANEAVALLGGLLSGKPYTADELKELSRLPAKPVMQAQMLGTLQAVPRGFVCVLAGRLRSLLYLINAYVEKRGGVPAEAETEAEASAHAAEAESSAPPEAEASAPAAEPESSAPPEAEADAPATEPENNARAGGTPEGTPGE
jgi:large subunit ribosomal protein L10